MSNLQRGADMIGEERMKCSNPYCGWIGPVSQHRSASKGDRRTELRCLRCNGNSFHKAKPDEVERPKNGAQLIALERGRQLKFEGHLPEHDDKHVNGELSAAAASYADAATLQTRSGVTGEFDASEIKANVIEFWPFGEESFKVSGDPIRNLVKAGALIAAEIDRLQRKQILDAHQPHRNK